MRRSEQARPGADTREVLLEPSPLVPAADAAGACLVPVGGDDFLPVVPVGQDVAIYAVHVCPEPEETSA
jgi:hypothetical protein